MRWWILSAFVVIVAALHQDFWFWENSYLVFGFLPIGLAYHACYSVLASIMMMLLVKYAWPSHLEKLESHSSEKPVNTRSET